MEDLLLFGAIVTFQVWQLGDEYFYFFQKFNIFKNNLIIAEPERVLR
jgi:hypothetical protein